MRISTRDLLSGSATGQAQTSGPIQGGAHGGQFPLRTRARAKEYLLAHGGPDTLAVFESGGGLLHALRAEGVNALSVDQREPDHKEPSFQGDGRAIIDLEEWRTIYFVGPNWYCYQNRKYVACLSKKIDDGRVYWGAVMVRWCICCARQSAPRRTTRHDHARLPRHRIHAGGGRP
jgi:hypothetical protein